MLWTGHFLSGCLGLEVLHASLISMLEFPPGLGKFSAIVSGNRFFCNVLCVVLRFTTEFQSILDWSLWHHLELLEPFFMPPCF